MKIHYSSRSKKIHSVRECVQNYVVDYPASRVSFDLPSFLSFLLPLPDFSRKIEGDSARRVVVDIFIFIFIFNFGCSLLDSHSTLYASCFPLSLSFERLPHRLLQTRSVPRGKAERLTQAIGAPLFLKALDQTQSSMN